MQESAIVKIKIFRDERLRLGLDNKGMDISTNHI